MRSGKFKLLVSILTLSYIITGCGGGSSSSKIAKNMLKITDQNQEEVLKSFKASTSITVSTLMFRVANSLPFFSNAARQCDISGSVSINTTAIKSTLIYDKCKDRDFYHNGSISAEQSGNKVTYTTKEFEEYTYDANGKKYFGFKIKDFSLMYDNSNNIEIVVDGDFQNFKNNHSLTLKDYKINSSSNKATIDGYFSSKATDNKWIEIEQIKEFAKTEGEVKLNGKKSYMSLKVKPDKSIDLYVNGKFKHNYKDWSDIPDYFILPANY